MERLSVRARIAVIATAAAGLVLLVVSVLIVRLVENDVRAAAQDALTQALADQAVEMGGATGGFEAGRDTTFDLVVAGRTYELGLFDELSEGNATGELVVDGELTKVLEIDLRTNQVVAVFDPATNEPINDPGLTAQLEELTFDILDVDGDQGSTLLVGASALADIDASTAAIRGALGVTIPLVVLLFGVMAWWLAGRALRPVGAIADQVQVITTTNLDHRVPIPAGRDEVAELAVLMNEMLDRLEEGDQKQQQFSADASHELRSPLTTIRAAAEAIESRPDSGRAGELSAYIVAETDRMDTLIGDLLELARLATGERPQHGPVDLGLLVMNLLDGAGAEVKTEGGLGVLGDEKQLARLVRNLVENAQRHATNEVRVCVARFGTVARLTVEDDGPGIAATDRAQVFERFARLDHDRSRRSGGSGLGLALAKSIAQSHGATIAIDESLDLGGARFSVDIPIADTPKALRR